MVIQITTQLPSLGLESKECLGFETDYELELALEALTQDSDENYEVLAS